MSKPTEKELREMDCWIAENVFSLPVIWEDTKRKHAQYLWFRKHPECNGRGCLKCRKTGNECEIVARYTATDAPALEVLEKCGDKTEEMECLYLGKVGGEWLIGQRQLKIEESADTLPLAIAKFAKKLFSK